MTKTLVIRLLPKGKHKNLNGQFPTSQHELAKAITLSSNFTIQQINYSYHFIFITINTQDATFGQVNLQC